MEKKGKTIIIVALLASIVATALGASYVLKYTIQKPAKVTITMNTWKINLFSNVECTNPVVSLNFTSLEEGAGGSCTIGPYWIKNLASTRQIRAGWNATGLPTGLTMTARAYDPSTGDPASWAENGLINLYQGSGGWGWIIKCDFSLTADPSVAQGDYNWTVNFFSKEYIA